MDPRMRQFPAAYWRICFFGLPIAVTGRAFVFGAVIFGTIVGLSAFRLSSPAFVAAFSASERHCKRAKKTHVGSYRSVSSCVSMSHARAGKFYLHHLKEII